MQARLLLVGQTRFAPYADAIASQVRELNLDQVHIVGPVSDERLAAMFRRAAAFVTVSEHEGFCVPLLEALAFDVPVVARACAAIPETLGGAGLLLPERVGPELVAEAIGRIVARQRPARRPRAARPLPSRRAHPDRCERRDVACDRRGRVMRLLYVVQRYGEEVAGGAEQHARAFAERLVERGHDVTVLTTCAESYVDWANAYPRGWSSLNGVAVLRTPVTKARNPHLFARFNSRISTSPGVRPLSVQREWMRMQGPYTPALVPWLRRHATGYDAVVFITYLYWTTWAGLQVCGGAVPTLLHPTAHDEPPMRLSIFQEVLRLPDAFAFLTSEEAELVYRALPRRAGRCRRRHRRRDGPARRRRRVPAQVRDRRHAVSPVRRSGRSREGRG